MPFEKQDNKSHRKSKEKKARSAGDHNPKAFTFSRPGRLDKAARRSQDVKEKRFHVPLVDRTPEEPPPLIVAVMGPPQVGKSTLIKSLVRRYSKQTLSTINGPITVVTSKRRRLTFIECPSDSLESMIDIAKVVDIVLLLIDGHFGFEMETMEFLNILSSLGMPGNVFGVLTKLDLYTKQETLKARKKQLKQRFWGELYQGAKLFYLSGIANGRYPDREVLNLSRFLSVMKNPRPLVWRNAHPYCLADRFVDLTLPGDKEKNPKCDRTIALYGYLRGTNFPSRGMRVHIPGVGDVDVIDVEKQADPCPTPHMEKLRAQMTGKSQRRRLGERQKVLYGPMSDVGGVLMDKDAVYIDIQNPTLGNAAEVQRRLGLGEQMVSNLHGDRQLLGEAEDQVQLFRNNNQFNATETIITDDAEDISSSHVSQIRRPAFPANKAEELTADLNRDQELDDTDEDSMDGFGGMDDEDSAQEKDLDLSDQSSDDDIEEDVGDQAHIQRDRNKSPLLDADEGYESGALGSKFSIERGADPEKRTVKELAALINDLTLSAKDVVERWQQKPEIRTDQHDRADDDFFTTSGKSLVDSTEDDRYILEHSYKDLAGKWTDREHKLRLLSRFTLSRSKENKQKRLAQDDGSDDDSFGDEDDNEEDNDEGGISLDGDSDEGDGEFVDLEANDSEKPTDEAVKNDQSGMEAERLENARKKEELKLRFEEEDRGGFAKSKAGMKAPHDGNNEAEFGEDEWYDSQKTQIQQQLNINAAELAQLDERQKMELEGHKAGTYVRLLLTQIPCEFVDTFDPRFPIVIGGINATEDRFGFVRVRIKRHRWHQRILKSNDPLIVSLGWRRFQTIPIYSTSDSRTRDRMLKYTPEHMHCFGTFYGPLAAPNTGFVCVQSFSNTNSGFRIAANGVVLSVDESTQLVKKLKLKGYPHKIFKNTAIIRDLFQSELEAAKFKAANLRTVSGIRGMVKGRAGNQFPDGYIRAGFEDKILMSDIVFLSTWAEVKPREFYMPVTNLLTSTTKTQSQPQIQHDTDTERKEEDDDHQEGKWQGMRLTGEVRAALNLPVPDNQDSRYTPIERPTRHFNPLRVPRKLATELPFKSQLTQMKPQRQGTYLQKRAVVLGGEEKAARDLMSKLNTIRNEKVAKRRVAQEKRREPYRKKMQENLALKEAREKRERDEYWRREGKKTSNKRKRED